MKIYLAGILFSEAERDWMKKLKGQIERLVVESGRTVQVIWPYELLTQEEIHALGKAAKHEIFSRCKSHLEDSDLVIALLDGTQVDDGTAWEIGYFYRNRSERSLIIGVRTDFRNAGETNGSVVNAMIECSCDQIVRTSEELIKVIKEALEPA